MSGIMVPAGSSGPELSSGSQAASFSLCPHTDRAERRRLSHESEKGTDLIREGSTLISTPNSNCLHRAPPPKTITARG